jgi:hypothetical protein
MKIILGTAHFADEYGWNHVKAKEVHKILDKALDLGIDTIETAYDYHCLDALATKKSDFNFIFKCDTMTQKKIGMEALTHADIMKHHPPYNDGWKAISVYNSSSRFGPGVEMVEFPYNLIDQRFGVIIPSECEIIVRSVFIQGLAFQMPDFHGIPFYHLCWNFVRNNPNIDGIVVGVDSAAQLEDILSIPQYEIDYSKIGQDRWIKKY